MAADEQIRDVVEMSPGEQRRLRAVLPGLPRFLTIEREAERHAGREAARHADRHADRQCERQTGPSERPQEPVVKAPDASGDHFGDALQLVRAASDALERMRTRYREIETFSARQTEYYQAELGAAQAVIADLQEQTLARDETIQRLEAQARADAEQRCGLEDALRDMSEAAEALRDQYQQVEARATSAEGWLTRFQGEIASAFGEIPRILGEIHQEAEAASRNEQRRVANGHG